MTAPQKVYGLTLKPHVKIPSRKFIETPASEARPDLLPSGGRAARPRGASVPAINPFPMN
jgi:hypothetical protein